MDVDHDGDRVSLSKEGNNPGPGPRPPTLDAELVGIRRAQIALTSRIDEAARAFVRQGERIESLRADLNAVAARGIELIARVEKIEAGQASLNRMICELHERVGALVAGEGA